MAGTFMASRVEQGQGAAWRLEWKAERRGIARVGDERSTGSRVVGSARAGQRVGAYIGR